MKGDTLKTLQSNNAALPELEANIRQLNTNEQLREVSLTTDARPVQSILDALPADENRLALGASLQQKLFTDVDGLVLDSLSVDPSSMSSEVVAEDGGDDGVKSLAFSASITGNPEALKRALQRLERSIRAINIKRIEGTGSSNSVATLQITGVAYYQPAPSLELTTKEVKQ